jgi:hypothetical protein
MSAGDALGGIGEAIGSGFGELGSQGYRDMSDKEYEEALRQLLALKGPEYASIVAEQMGPSAMENIRADPNSVAAQMQALEHLQRVGTSGGLTAQDEAKFLAAQDRVAEQERGSRGALMANFAARGQGGGMQELAAQLSNQQGAANRLNRAGTDMAGDAQRRAYEAMVESGNLGSRIRGQDFGEKSQRAQATDAINRFNAGTRNDVNQFNANMARNRYLDNMQLEKMKSAARFGKADRWNEKADAYTRRLAGAGRASGSLAGAAGDVGMTAAGTPQGQSALRGYLSSPKQPPRPSYGAGDYLMDDEDGRYA